MQNEYLIYAHNDVDGIVSARIAQLTEMYRNARVIFTPYISFGVEGLPENLPSHLLCLDIGSDEETLQKLSEISETGVKVILIDHHPTDIELIRKYQSKDFRIMHDENHCTASLAYTIFRNLNMFRDSVWAEVWCCVGIYGDVAKDKPKANEVLRELAPKHPELISQLNSSDENVWMYQPASIIARSMNMVRRIAYHYGAEVCLKACEEAERAGDPFILIRDISLEEQVKYPYIALMKQLAEKYKAATKYVNHKLLDLDLFGVALISCKADIGGLVAKREVRKLKKPVFVLNDGIMPGRVKISGRSENLDLNRVGEIVERLSSGKIKFGGHPQAVSGSFPAMPISQILTYLRKAVEEMMRG